MTSPTIHAGCVVIGTLGILVRGKSGAGKSVLSDTLIEAARVRGGFGALVSDDRTSLEVRSGVLIASAPDNLKGLIEVRGMGIVPAPYEAEAAVRLVVELADPSEVERLPDQPLATVEVAGLEVPAVYVSSMDISAAVRSVRWALRRLFPNGPDYV